MDNQRKSDAPSSTDTENNADLEATMEALRETEKRMATDPDPYWGSLRGKSIVNGVVCDERGFPEGYDPPPMENEEDRPPLFPETRRPR